jgi:hypothetical protein
MENFPTGKHNQTMNPGKLFVFLAEAKITGSRDKSERIERMQGKYVTADSPRCKKSFKGVQM